MAAEPEPSSLLYNPLDTNDVYTSQLILAFFDNELRLTTTMQALPCLINVILSS